MNLLTLKSAKVDLSFALVNMQRLVIGVFSSQLTDYKFKPVIKNQEGLLTIVRIGDMLGLQTLHTPMSTGRFRSFPDDKTLWDMMQDPIGFNHWWKQNCE